MVEDIDSATLKKIQKFEWEKKHGYWCTKCKKRFSSQAKLVDHMSYSAEHNYKETDKWVFIHINVLFNILLLLCC